MMKTNLSLARRCVLLVVAGLTACAAFADYGDDWGRVTAGFVQSLRNENVGGGVVGISHASHFGKNDTSEVSVEWMIGRWKTPRYDRFDRLVDSSRELHMPITVSYRYYLRSPHSPFALYGGVGAGLHMISNTFDPDFFFVEYNEYTGEADGWHEFFRRFDYAVTATGMLGFVINITKRGGIDIGVRWSWQSGSWHTFYDGAGIVRALAGASGRDRITRAW